MIRDFACPSGSGETVSPEHGKDITGAGSILAAVDAGAELTQRLEDVHVVAAHKVLRQIHDGHHEGLLLGTKR